MLNNTTHYKKQKYFNFFINICKNSITKNYIYTSYMILLSRRFLLTWAVRASLLLMHVVQGHNLTLRIKN